MQVYTYTQIQTQIKNLLIHEFTIFSPTRTRKALQPEMFHHSNDEDYDKTNIIFKFTKACISTHHQISCTHKASNKKKSINITMTFTAPEINNNYKFTCTLK